MNAGSAGVAPGPVGAPGQVPQINAEDRAIVVGIQIYPGLEDLGGAERDAAEFHAWVTSAAPAGAGVPANQATLICSSQFHPPFANAQAAHPAYAELESELLKLDDLAEQNNQAGKGFRIGRRLYLYFSGHGCAPTDDEAALLAADATRARAGLHLAGRPWANYFWRRGYFDEVILFMDCCRQSVPTVALRPPPFALSQDPNAVGQGRRFFVFATRWSKLVREIPFHGIIRGVFTYALLDGLAGKAADSNGRVTAASLTGWLSENVKQYLPAEGRDDPAVGQRPEFPNYDAGDAHEMVLAKVNPPGFPVLIDVPMELVGQPIELQDGSLTTAATLAAAPALWSVELARGIYRVQVTTPLGGPRGKTFVVSGTEGPVHVQL